MQLNCLFISSGFRGMLDGKDYRALAMVFLDTKSFIDRTTGFQRDADMDDAHCMYSDICPQYFHMTMAEGGLCQNL